MRVAHPAALAVAPALLSGCFIVNDPSVHLPEAVEGDELCGQFAQIYCDGLVTCFLDNMCGDMPVSSCRDGCSAAITTACQQLYGQYIADSRTGYDPAEAARQLTIGRGLAPLCDSQMLEWFVARGGLDRSFAGTLGPGESCDPTSALDEPVDSPRFYACGPDHACATDDGTSWRCVEPVGPGGDCPLGSGSRVCRDPLTCLTGTCVPRAAATEGCWSAADCATFSCFPGLLDASTLAPPGRCGSETDAYAQLIFTCDAPPVSYLGAAGPFFYGHACPYVSLCVTDPMTMMALDGVRYRCARTPPGGLCDGAFRCVYDTDISTDTIDPAGVMDVGTYAALCADANRPGVTKIECRADRPNPGG
ncbi:MAG: hypothetical protein AB7S26_41405 [Sandaracinaceae bacterium]